MVMVPSNFNTKKIPPLFVKILTFAAAEIRKPFDLVFVSFTFGKSSENKKKGCICIGTSRKTTL